MTAVQEWLKECLELAGAHMFQLGDGAPLPIEIVVDSGCRAWIHTTRQSTRFTRPLIASGEVIVHVDLDGADAVIHVDGRPWRLTMEPATREVGERIVSHLRESIDILSMRRSDRVG